ncbi:ComEC/Rec2 family competence protein [Luteimonas sp. A501]
MSAAIATQCRRLLLLLAAALLAVGHALAQAGPPVPELGLPMPPWSRGELDIHHINTGRGEAQLLILPDATSLLVDTSGKTLELPPFSLPTRPDASRPPGEWVARYVERVLPGPEKVIDYAVLSHFHGDHMGAVVADSPASGLGDYRLSGITEIAEHLPIARIIDRGWPDYDFPAPIATPTMENYRRFLTWQAANRGLQVERFEVGRADQLKLLRDAGAWPQFQIRNLYANGVLWSGVGEGTRALFPPLDSLEPGDRPTENTLSIAFRVTYGQFDYFTGGDLSSIDAETAFSPAPWKDVETPVGQASGPVDVMKANHHGSWDANSISFLAALRPRVIVVSARAEGHPAVNAWRRMTSKKAWPGERDIFVTNASEATFRTTYGLDQARSTRGHVVIRVAEGGHSYRVFVLDDEDERMTVKAVSGPYPAR